MVTKGGEVLMSNLINYDDCQNNVRERVEFCISCLAVGVIVGIFAAIAVGLLFYFGVISGLTIALWVAFGIGVFTLIATFLTAILTPIWYVGGCFCRNRRGLLIGGFGTVLTTVIALSITLASASVLSAIILALVTFFLLIAIFSLICFVICVSRCRD